MKIVRFLTICWLMLSFVYGMAQNDSPAISLIRQPGRMFVIELSPDDHTLARWESYALYDDDPAPELRIIRLIDIRTGNERVQLQGTSDYTMDVAFSTDGTILASVHRNGDINLWNTSDGTLLKRIETMSFTLYRAQFLADNRTLVVASGELPARFLYIDTETRAITHIVGRRFEQFEDFQTNYSSFPEQMDLRYTGFSVNATGDRLVSASQNGDLLLWEENNSEFPTSLYTAPESEAGRFNIRHVYMTPDGIYGVYFDIGRGEIIKYDLESRREVGVIHGGDAGLAVAPDGDRVAWADRETHALVISSFTTPNLIRSLVEVPETWNLTTLNTYPGAMSFTSDGNTLVAGGFGVDDEDNAIYVIDLNP